MGVAVPFTESQIRMLQQLSLQLRQPRSGIALDWEIFKEDFHHLSPQFQKW
jgi:hypothetical protein